MQRTTKRAAAAVAFAATLTGGAAFGAMLGAPTTSGAQSGSSSSTTSTTAPDAEAGTGEHPGKGPHGLFGAFDLSVAADALGLTEAELRTRLDDGDTLAEIAEAEGVDQSVLVDKLVAAGKKAIDEAAADAKANLEERITDLVEDGFPDHGGFPGGEGPGRPGHGFGFFDLSKAADALGLTEAQLRTRLEAGDSLADIAEAEGVTVDAVVKALVDAATAKIDEAVAAGDLSAERAAELKDGLADRIRSVVEDGLRGPWGHRPGR
jgi:hypothetical protein